MVAVATTVAVILGVLPAFLLANTKCSSNDLIKDHQQNKFLTMHNIRRSALANGTVTNTNGVALPKGNNILQMVSACIYIRHCCHLQCLLLHHARFLCATFAVTPILGNRLHLGGSCDCNSSQLLR
ncbi:hypothetical protein OESDEN_11685 [Oesophagostomum dentatum]|uniref:SCP domain-containing protein n=1 Tax=Oesophagostomum dentatum TaxID=61180 RepID=A0A0B1SX83_OESDE|nr:hypothetical protein OESDEN_11685 [Oesophagostomum dentatum]